jgi:hypothetical protein
MPMCGRWRAAPSAGVSRIGAAGTGQALPLRHQCTVPRAERSLAGFARRLSRAAVERLEARLHHCVVSEP